MILTLFLPTLETIVNRALRADPEALAKISATQNQVIEIHCYDWKIKFYIIVGARELQFEKKYDGMINTAIEGTLNNFLHIFIRGADSKTLFQYPIDIVGNTHNIEVLHDAFKNLDLDLEEKLSRVLGDTLAHKIFFHVSDAKKAVIDNAKKLQEQILEYIYFESKDLPTRKQVEIFYDDVAKLRDDVERTEAKITKMIEIGTTMRCDKNMEI